MKSGADASPRFLISLHNCDKPAIGANHGLHADRLAGHLADVADLSSSSSDTESTSGWRFGEMESLPAGMPRILAISSVTLVPGRMPPLPGLAPWLSFELEHLDLVVGGDFPELVIAEFTVFVAHAIFGGADLKDHIAATAQVMWRQAALAGVEPAVRQLGALRQGLDGGNRQGAEAHAGYVDDRLNLIRACRNGVRPPRSVPCAGFFIERRERAVDERSACRPASGCGLSRRRRCCRHLPMTCRPTRARPG